MINEINSDSICLMLSYVPIISSDFLVIFEMRSEFDSLKRN